MVIAFSLLWGWRDSEALAQEDLVARAQNERELVVYGTALSAQFEKFAELFRRRYPFIKTQYSRTTGEALTSKILREVAARQLSADVILINNYTHRIFMKKNIITAYSPPTAGNFPPGFIDKQGYWVGFYLVPYAITYNTKLVPKGSAPKSFDDLLSARWKGPHFFGTRRVPRHAGAHAIFGTTKSARIFQEAGAARADARQRA